MTPTTGETGISGSVSIVLPPALEDPIQRLVHASFMLPEAARKAMQMARDPDCDVDDFLKVVQRDPKLAADILCIANSAAFSPSQKIGSLQQAIVRLGMKQCRNLILAAAFSSLMTDWPAKYHVLRNALWRHSFATAAIAQKLNKREKLRFEGEEFTAGLIHDLGRFALAICNEKLGQLRNPGIGDEPQTILELERAATGSDHCEVGAFIIEVNGMPDGLRDTVRYHHSPESCPAEFRKLCSLISVADHMARYLFNFDDLGEYDPVGNLAIRVLAEETSPSLLESIPEYAGELIKEVAEAIKTDPMANG